MSAIDDFLEYDESHGIEKNANLWGALKSGWRGLVGGAAAPSAATVAREMAQTGVKPAVSPVADVAAKGAKELSEASLREGEKTLLGRMGSSLVGFGSNTARTVLPVLALGGALAGSEAAFSAAASAVSRNRGFRDMMEQNPELAKMDQKRVSAAFKTLHRFNPEMASDPYVSGGWVKRVTDYDYVDPKTIGDLVAARSRTTKPGIVERGLPLAAMGAQLAETERRQAFDVQKLMVADTLQRRRDQEQRDAAQDTSIARALAQAKAEGTALGESSMKINIGDVERVKAQQKALGQAGAIIQQPGKFEQAAMPARMGQLQAERQFAELTGAPSPANLEYQKAYAQQQARHQFGIDYGTGQGNP